MEQFPYRLMAPGPVALSKEVLEALSKPMLHHRTPEFSKVLENAFNGLKMAFGTKQPVFAISSTGSGGLEAAVVNCLSPGDTALCISSGKFGDRWEKICTVYGVEVQSIDVEWGKSVDPQLVKAALEKNPDIKVVFCQACETSTGALHPIKELGKIIKNYPGTLLAIDAITALGCMELPMDEWGLDIVVAGSQKAFKIPTGLAFIALSEKAWKAQKESKCPKFYFDLALEKKAYDKGQTHFSSSVALIQALNISLVDFTDTTLKNSIKRSESLALASRKTIEALGWSVYPENPSSSLTVIACPKEIDGTKWRKMVEEKFNITLMEGQDQLKGKIIRIGHMGAISDEDLLETFKALVSCYNELSNAPITDSTLTSALDVCKSHLEEQNL